jgi:methylated-DNA-[protein]-cysteine S-methyltransferase
MTAENDSLERALRAAPPAHDPPALDLERAAAAGLLDVAYATLDSPVGTLLLARTKRGLIRVSYTDRADIERARRVSPRVLEAPGRLDDARRQLEEYFAGRRRSFEVDLDWRLTHGFTRRVLQATARIPWGSVSSYKQVAAAAGSPRGSRAAGNALGANPLPIVVPCHRVLHAGGGLGGYTGGLERKRALLAVEGTLHDSA